MFRLLLLIFYILIPSSKNMKIDRAIASPVKEFSNIPSGSGVELLDEKLFIAGDDSPFLFIVNEKDNEIRQKIRLTEGQGERLEKPKKPDIEAMAYDNRNGKDFFYLFGSGGISPYREDLFIVEPGQEPSVTRVPLHNFYQEIIKRQQLQQNQLNIEAAVIVDDVIYLFNRGKSFIVTIKMRDFRKSIADRTTPDFEVIELELPSHEHHLTGFSGATGVDNSYIVFTATAEATADYIQDGAIAGSFAGLIKIKDLKNGLKPELKPITSSTGEHLKHKIESLAIRKKNKESLECYAVADNDNGTTVLFDLKLELK